MSKKTYYIVYSNSEMHSILQLQAVVPENPPRCAYSSSSDAVYNKVTQGCMEKLFILSFIAHEDEEEDCIPVDFALTFLENINRVYTVTPTVELLLDAMSRTDSSPFEQYSVECVEGHEPEPIKMQEIADFSAKVCSGQIQMINGQVQSLTGAISLLRQTATTLMLHAHTNALEPSNNEYTRVVGPYGGTADIPTEVILNTFDTPQKFYYALLSDPTDVLDAAVKCGPYNESAMQFVLWEAFGSAMAGQECSAVLTAGNLRNLMRQPAVQQLMPHVENLVNKAVAPVLLHAPITTVQSNDGSVTSPGN